MTAAAEPVPDLNDFKAIMQKRPQGEGAVVLTWCDECGEHFYAIRLPDRVSPRDDRNTIEVGSRHPR